MKTTVNETISQENEPILQLNRQLLSIGEYAAREGVPKGVIEECGKLGIVQIRKHKGKTFVVDVPILRYCDKCEPAAMPTRGADKITQADKISELVKKVIPETPETVEGKPQSDQRFDSKTIQAANIDHNGTVFKSIQMDFPERLEIADEQTAAIDSEIELTEEITQLHTEAIETAGQSSRSANGDIDLDKNIFASVKMNSSGSPEIAKEPTTAAHQTSQTESPPEIVQTPELQASGIIDDLNESIDEIGEIEEKPESVRAPQADRAKFGTPAATAKSKRSWQVTAVFLFICLFAAIVGSLWLYMDRGIQLGRLNQVYAGVQRTYNDYTQAIKHAETVQNELDDSRAQLERMRNELENSKTEVKTVRDELALAEQNFEAARQYNADAAEQLNEQIQALATQLANLAENP